MAGATLGIPVQSALRAWQGIVSSSRERGLETGTLACSRRGGESSRKQGWWERTGRGCPGVLLTTVLAGGLGCPGEPACWRQKASHVGAARGGLGPAVHPLPSVSGSWAELMMTSPSTHSVLEF